MRVAALLACFFVLTQGRTWSREFPCGRSMAHQQPRYIGGGRRAKPGEFPWMVYLQLQSTTVGHTSCGGSIIAPDVVLTAASCLINRTKLASTAAAGFLNLQSESPYQQTRSFAEFFVHEDYVPDLEDNDIGLIRLSEPFDFRKSGGHIGAVCLPNEKTKPKGMVTVAGWGAIPEVSARSGFLLAVTVPISPFPKCSALYPDNYDFDPPGFFCAGTTGKSFCKMDIGGAAVQKKGRVSVQVGIASVDNMCTLAHGYYTSVAAYTEWIQQHLDMFAEDRE